MIITARQLRLVAKKMTAASSSRIAPLINATCSKYGIDKKMLPEFLANVLHESGEFRIKAENMNYTSAERLIAIWPSRFNKDNASDFVKNPQRLANFVYNGRMGNRINSNDGFIFRGGGFAQITGRDAYEAYRRHLKSDLTAEQIADQVQNNDSFAMDSAGWFFCVFKDLEKLAIEDKMLEIVRRWNGGTIGLAERNLYYNRLLVL